MYSEEKLKIYSKICLRKKENQNRLNLNGLQEYRLSEFKSN